MDTDGPVPTSLPSAKSGRSPPTLAKFSSWAPRPVSGVQQPARPKALGTKHIRTRARNAPASAEKLKSEGQWRVPAFRCAGPSGTIKVES
eukprot:scaffold744_cov111-Isochrysis_galbana.AAC.3